MPPPLLSRHLRSYRSPWSTHHIRCASSTAHAKLSNVSDDGPKRSSPSGGVERKRAEDPDDVNTEGNGEAQHSTTSWWKATLRSISSFETSTATTDPTTPPPAADHPPKPRAPEVVERPYDRRSKSQPSEQHLGKHYVQAEEVARDDGHQGVTLEEAEGRSKPAAHDYSAATSPQAAQEDAQTGQNAKFQIKKMVLTKTSKYNPTIDGMLRRKVKLAGRQNNEILREDRIVESSRVSQAKENPRIPNDTTQETIKQQLQQLSKQVEALREALEKKTFAAEQDLKEETQKGASTSHPDKHARATRIHKDVDRARSEPAELHQQPTQRSKTGPTKAAARGITRHGNSAGHVIARANGRFRNSISELISVAHALRRVEARVSKPMIAMVEGRLVGLGQDARRVGDGRMVSTLQKYNRWDKLAAVSSIPPMPRSTPSNGTKEQQSATSTAPTSAREDHHTSVPLVRRVELMTKKDKRSAEKQIVALSDLGGAPAGTDSARVIHNKQENVAEAVTADSKLKSTEDSAQSARDQQATRETNKPVLSEQMDKQQLVRHIHTQSRAMLSSTQLQHSALWVPAEKEPLQELRKSPIPETKTQPQTSSGDTVATPAENPPVSSNEVSDQSLLEELFPEASVAPPARQVEKQEQYPKLDPPESAKLIHRELVDRPMTFKEQATEAFKKRGEPITALQLEHCSTELTEPDFRRLIPKGEHIEAWNRLGAYYKIIPGRDPLSLERLPFYYLLFKSPESAHAYQRNAGRLHKLAALHQPSSIFSAIPAPKGFLEDGEDIDAITSSYLLRPTEHAFTLRTLVQPYHPALRTLFDQGGYKPIVSSDDNKKNHTHKVLMHIEGYEPSLSDLFLTLKHDAYNRGIPFTLRNESSSSIHRLRDLINLKTYTLPTSNPRSFEGHKWNEPKIGFEDPSIAFFMRSEGAADEENAKVINQVVMNRVYNRWIIDFDDEDEARRFAISWHRRVLPDFAIGQRTWKDYEEVRMCNTELLW